MSIYNKKADNMYQLEQKICKMTHPIEGHTENQFVINKLCLMLYHLRFK